MTVIRIPVDITPAELMHDLIKAANDNGYDVTYANLGYPFADPAQPRDVITLHVRRRQP